MWLVQCVSGSYGEYTVDRTMGGTLRIAENKIWLYMGKERMDSQCLEGQSVVWVPRRAIIFHPHRESSFIY